MIGIVLVTHGNLAREFIAALEHVVGPQQCVSAVCIGADDDMEKRRAEILESAKACDTGDGVIVLTDMFGGTPANLGLPFLAEQQVEVITGVNLPMLLKLARPPAGMDLLALAREMREHGRNAIWVASELLKGQTT
jgi:mannose PTS system EIIA component